jgi:integrase
VNERSGGGYRKAALGNADDIRDANGLDILNYQQAQRKAHEFFDRCAREHMGLAAPAEVEKVSDAIRLYLGWFRSDRRSYTETKGSAERHILPKLGDVSILKLNPQRIRAWRDELAESPALGRKGKPLNRTVELDPDEAARRRKVTANRVLVILKAALEHAYREHGAGMPDAWRRVQPFQSVDAARQRWPDRDECIRLLNACEPDFRALVRGALETGARYEELTGRLRVADFHRDGPSILIPPGKSGRARQVPLDADGAAFFAALTAGRTGDAPMFLQANGQPWGTDAQIRRMRATSQRAEIKPPVNFHSLRHAYASLRIMNGAPLAVVAAALGHSTTRMVEKHYGHLAPSFVRTTIEGTGLGLGAETGNVVRLPAAAPKATKIRLVRREPAS